MDEAKALLARLYEDVQDCVRVGRAGQGRAERGSWASWCACHRHMEVPCQHAARASAGLGVGVGAWGDRHLWPQRGNVGRLDCTWMAQAAFPPHH